MWLYSNYFTGTIPSSFSHASHFYYLDSNRLTGSIPPLGTELLSVSEMSVSSNFLTGSLPSRLFCFAIVASTNYISGNFPSDLWKSLLYTQLFDFSSNLLTGSLPSKLLGSYLEGIFLNDNRFTGIIPNEFFNDSKVLISIVMSSNCFSGTLPSTLCSSNRSLQIAMGGLHSAPYCERRALPFIKNSGVIVSRAVGGTIPQCLFGLPHLSTLQLGGNSLTGTLPDVLLSNLTELVLANNQLMGTIPAFIWSSGIQRLDLSFNYFEGSIPADALPVISTVYNASLKLQVNRLSGTVPEILWSLKDINVLEGNLFSCNMQRSNIPENDPKYGSYNCGSDATNDALLAFGSLLVFFLIICLAWRSRILEWTILYVENARQLQNETMYLFTSIRTFGTVYVFMLLVIGCLFYGLLSRYFAMYTYSFVWTISAAYLQGMIPAVSMLVVFSSLIVAACVYFPLHVRYSESGGHVYPMTARTKQLLSFMPIIVDIVVILVVNGSYVVALHNGYSSDQLTVISFAIACFKIIWNYLLLLDGAVWGIPMELSGKTVMILSLFNNLLAPLFAELFVSSNCFLYILTQAPELTITYVNFGDLQDIEYDNTIYQIPTQKTSYSFVPSFSYSYQCSSSLLAQYCYVFTFRYILSGIVEPMIGNVMVLKGIQPYVQNKRWEEWMRKAIPILWKLEIAGDEVNEDSLQLLETSVKSHPGRLRKKLICRMVTDVSMLFTFGTLFPPLSLVVWVSIVKDIWSLQLSLGRMWSIAQRVQDTSIRARIVTVVDKVLQELYNMNKVVWQGLWYGVMVSSWIWAMLLFDTLSSTEGISKSIWIPIVLAMTPIACYVVRAGYTILKNRSQASLSDIQFKVDGNDVESVKNPVLEMRSSTVS